MSANEKQNSASRRDFLKVTAAAGIGSLAGEQAASALGQDARGSGGDATLPKIEPVRMFEGTAAAAALEQLRAAGVKTIFHTNTSGFSPLWDAIYAAGDVQIIMVTHEGQGVATAAGYAMASKSLGFFVGSGAGIGNSISNLYCAWKDRVPMLVTFSHGDIEAQGKDEAESWDGNLKPTEPFTVWSGSLLTDEITDVMRRAMQFAYGPPSGPVTLDWGNANQGEKVKVPIHKMDLGKTRHSFRAKADLIEKAARWIAEAKNPVFIAGPEITEADANVAFQQLAEKLSVPVTVLGWPNELYANFATDHPLFLGEYDALRYPRNTDLVVNFGEKFAIRQPQGVATVHISRDPSMLGRVFPADLAIASDIRLAIRDLSDALDGVLTKDRMSRIRASRLAEVAGYSTKLKQSRELALRGRFESNPISWERVGYELEKALDKNAVIVPEVGTQSPKLLGQLTFGPDNKLRIGRTTGSALGWGVAAAFGVNLALPDRQVVSIQGDGGILFGQTETMWSISRYEAPMLIVVMNNGVYNDSRARNMSNGGLLFENGKDLTGHLGNPDVDFTKLAEAYSLRAEKVRAPGDLAPALQRAVRSMREGKAVLLDVKIKPDGQPLSEATWYMKHSIFEAGRKKRSA
jgi:thiamine pyrophosphate-dependent acetolactate synthase large subunit-like protein